MVIEPTFMIVLIIVFFSTFIRSTFGFGDALIAMPLLAVLVGLKTATPLVALIAFTIALTILMRNWRQVEFKSAWRLIVATVAGIPLGLYFLKGTYESMMKIILAVIIIGFAVYHLLRPTLMHLKHEKTAFLFGFFAGVLGGAYNTNGPPIVIYGSLRRWNPESFRATLQGYFFMTGVFILLGHASSGLWTKDVITYYLIALPVVFVSIWLGGRLHHRIPRGRFDQYIHILLVFIGLFLLIETLL